MKVFFINIIMKIVITSVLGICMSHVITLLNVYTHGFQSGNVIDTLKYYFMGREV